MSTFNEFDFLHGLGIRVIPIEDFEYRSVYVKNARILLVRAGLTAEDAAVAVDRVLADLPVSH